MGAERSGQEREGECEACGTVTHTAGSSAGNARLGEKARQEQRAVSECMSCSTAGSRLAAFIVRKYEKHNVWQAWQAGRHSLRLHAPFMVTVRHATAAAAAITPAAAAADEVDVLRLCVL